MSGCGRSWVVTKRPGGVFLGLEACLRAQRLGDFASLCPKRDAHDTTEQTSREKLAALSKYPV